MEKFQNKYRIPSARAKWWDYGRDGLYFITICTACRKCLLGNIVNSDMRLSPIGEIVRCEWDKSFKIRKELLCDTFVIMPNHIHAILRIDREAGGGDDDGGTGGDDAVAAQGCAPQRGVAYRSPKSISSFVAGFKSATTKLVNERWNTPKIVVWQPRFHDHIIRNDDEYRRIADYINNNPRRWTEDKFHAK
ncbi:MAG: hypothetical protein LBH84_02300 [Prevotellaceae bacterium]|jgi:REP element-mobilizing transposase RayT|nr:hypothetical protein [Prevotellaceae bacterium]